MPLSKRAEENCRDRKSRSSWQTGDRVAPGLALSENLLAWRQYFLWTFRVHGSLASASFLRKSLFGKATKNNLSFLKISVSPFICLFSATFFSAEKTLLQLQRAAKAPSTYIHACNICASKNGTCFYINSLAGCGLLRTRWLANPLSGLAPLGRPIENYPNFF